MKIAGFIAALVLGFTSLAQAEVIPSVDTESIPTMDINGVAHYLLDEDEAANRVFQTASGYCVSLGYSYSDQSVSYMMRDKAPLVALDSSGNVIATYDSNNGRMWVIGSLSCK